MYPPEDGAAIAADDELITRVRTGDREAYAELVHRYAPMARRTAALLGAGADADDVVQEALVKAYRALGRFRELLGCAHDGIRSQSHLALGGWIRARPSDDLPYSVVHSEEDGGNEVGHDRLPNSRSSVGGPAHGRLRDGGRRAVGAEGVVGRGHGGDRQ